MIYHNTPLTGSLQLSRQILEDKSARSDSPMSNAAWKQLGILSEVLRKSDKHEVLPSHDYYVGQCVVYQGATSKWWHPATTKSLCPEKKNYTITTSDGFKYRKNTSLPQALYTTRQDLAIFSVCKTSGGTIKAYVASENSDGTI